MSVMTDFLAAEACARCRSLDGVRTVKYVRSGQSLTEPWCQPCRRAKLVRTDKAGEDPNTARGWKAPVILALAVLGALLAWNFGLESLLMSGFGLLA